MLEVVDVLVGLGAQPKPWLDVPGNFILARAAGNVLTAIYVGQTASLRDRLPAYVEWEVARHAGATSEGAGT